MKALNVRSSMLVFFVVICGFKLCGGNQGKAVGKNKGLLASVNETFSSLTLVTTTPQSYGTVSATSVIQPTEPSSSAFVIQPTELSSATSVIQPTEPSLATSIIQPTEPSSATSVIQPTEPLTDIPSTAEGLQTRTPYDNLSSTTTYRTETGSGGLEAPVWFAIGIGVTLFLAATGVLLYKIFGSGGNSLFGAGRKKLHPDTKDIIEKGEINKKPPPDEKMSQTDKNKTNSSPGKATRISATPISKYKGIPGKINPGDTQKVMDKIKMLQNKVGPN